MHPDPHDTGLPGQFGGLLISPADQAVHKRRVASLELNVAAARAYRRSIQHDVESDNSATSNLHTTTSVPGSLTVGTAQNGTTSLPGSFAGFIGESLRISQPGSNATESVCAYTSSRFHVAAAQAEGNPGGSPTQSGSGKSGARPKRITDGYVVRRFLVLPLPFSACIAWI